jgi:predicted transcriptional regulator
MNELTSDVRMSLQEIAEILNKDESTIRKIIIS